MGRCRHETAYLPRLDRNIRWGNSLLSPEDLPHALFGAPELRRRINPFDWHDPVLGFGEVFDRRSGFDAVIRNPPYTRVQTLRRYGPEETDAYIAKYRSAAEGSFDIAFPFVERGLELLRPDGRLGFIISRQFTEADAGRALRELLSDGNHVRQIIDFGFGFGIRKRLRLHPHSGRLPRLREALAAHSGASSPRRPRAGGSRSRA